MQDPGRVQECGGPGYFRPLEPDSRPTKKPGPHLVFWFAQPAVASRPEDLGDQERAKVVADLAIPEVELEGGQ